MTQPRWLWPKSSVTRVIAHLRYARYVALHKLYVLRAGLQTGAPLWRLLIHDWSKLTPAEWGPYVRAFYKGQGVRESGFHAAWLHHQHHNPHHWQHWVLREDDGDLMALPMPEHFAREMVADWAGAGRAITGSWDVSEWYAKHTEIMVLHPDTRVLVEELLARRA